MTFLRFTRLFSPGCSGGPVFSTCEINLCFLWYSPEIIFIFQFNYLLLLLFGQHTHTPHPHTHTHTQAHHTQRMIIIHNITSDEWKIWKILAVDRLSVNEIWDRARENKREMCKDVFRQAKIAATQSHCNVNIKNDSFSIWRDCRRVLKHAEPENIRVACKTLSLTIWRSVIPNICGYRFPFGDTLWMQWQTITMPTTIFVRVCVLYFKMAQCNSSHGHRLRLNVWCLKNEKCMISIYQSFCILFDFQVNCNSTWTY